MSAENTLPPTPKGYNRLHLALYVVTLISLLCIAATAGYLYGYTHSPVSTKIVRVFVASTPAAIKVTAMQVYRVFASHGLNTKSDGVENDKYYWGQGISTIQGGTVVLTDNDTNLPDTISTFASPSDASRVATELFNGGDNAYESDGVCMLHVSFASHVSEFTAKEYKSLMDAMCK